MHYITVLYERTYRNRCSPRDAITLRGYDARTWIPAEFSSLQLPVYALAFAICPTFRDIYLERVLGQRIEETWARYKGRVIDEVYKLLHKECEEYATGSRVANFDLYHHVTTKCDQILSKAKKDHASSLRKIASQPSSSEISSFDTALKKLVSFEALITAALMDFEVARIESANPRRIFSEFFDFNTDMALRARHQGFTTPARPDFIYRHEVIGDVKSGTWHQFMEYTVVAYALAYEEHTGLDMNYGAVLHVALPKNRQVPGHYHADIIYLDDERRKRFLAVRDRRLQIVANEIDPGTPAERTECDPECPFLSYCWGTT